MPITLGSKFRPEEGSLTEAVVDYAIGGYTGVVRATEIVGNWVYTNTIRPFANHALGMNLLPGMRPKVENGTIKVAAVGFGRTGTYSLMLALEELGYPTLHTIHMYEYDNEEILRMLDDKIVSPALATNEAVVRDVDLELIANSGYQAVADLPFVLFFEQIYKEYPDCKFILTTRETSEIWYRSWASLSKSVSNGMHIAGIVFPTVRLYSKYLRFLFSFINKDNSYLTATIPSDENIKENAIATYEEHNRRVRELIPANQLLEFDVRGGWEPVCTFLEVTDCPTTPFPKTNSARQMRAQTVMCFWFGALLLALLFQTVRKTTLRGRKQKVS